jgi:hypothetical protein
MKDEIEALGTRAVKELRRSRLSKGEFFMINVNSLPPDHCYLEYPGGTIKLASYESRARKFIILRELEDDESIRLREKVGLDQIQ